MAQALPTDYQLKLRDFPVGAQMLFVAFGALVLVPLLTGLDPNVALFCAGIGTLIYQVLTKFQIPIFLGSSFAFIAPVMLSMQRYGMAATLGGLASVGVVYILIALLNKSQGHGLSAVLSAPHRHRPGDHGHRPDPGPGGRCTWPWARPATGPWCSTRRTRPC